MPGVSPRSLLLILLLSSTTLAAQDWTQWGRTARHDNVSSAIGRSLDRIEARLVLDPFASQEQAAGYGDLYVHYAVPLVDGNDLFLVQKSGSFFDLPVWESQTWNVTNVRRSGSALTTRWTRSTDWKPVPYQDGLWEPVYHCALTPDAIWAPGAGGTIDKINREDGTLIRRFNPFGTSLDPTIFTAGPPAVDAADNIVYTTIKLDPGDPWDSDSAGAWLIRIDPSGTITRASFSTLVQGAPTASSSCTTVFAFPGRAIALPPSRNAIAPGARCGPQRPGLNVTPAIAEDGTIYVISRAHLNDRWGYLVAVNPDLSPKWTASLRNRFLDGCNVTIPPNGTRGGCSIDAMTGVDPADNLPGSGRVNDDSTSSPAVAPDGTIFYGAYTRYNYAQGHLMAFSPDGRYAGAYGWGWDLTPAIYPHDQTYSILLKENHYSVGSWCNDESICPSDRSINAPSDPERYFITQLDSSLRPEWKFRSTNTQSCERDASESVQCVETSPNGFEWCVNAIAVDRLGRVYANSEDGNLYAIDQGGILAGHLFLRLALGAGYTPTSIGADGRIYTQNFGELFIIGQALRRRAARP